MKFTLMVFIFLGYGFYSVEVAAGHGCDDHHPKCIRWAAKGECRKNPKWMLQHCRQSCGKCSQANVHDLLQQAESQHEGDFMILGYIVIVAAIGIVVKIYFGGTNARRDVKLKGKTVIITGANTGIGKETARDLAWRKARVIMGCRDFKKGLKAAEEIVKSTGNLDVEVKKLDLASFKSVREFAKEINEEEYRVDILINNAGYLGPSQKTSDGLERAFQVNYLSHFLLTHLLLEKLKTSSPSRIINVSSNQHFSGKINFSDLHAEDKFGYSSYNQSKLAQVLFTRELANKLKGTKVTVNALHPGVISTEILRNYRILNMWILKPLLWLTQYWFFKTPIQGAQTTIHCAVDPGVAEVSGGYFVDCQQVACSSSAMDDGVAKKLYELSEGLSGLNREN